MEHHGIPQEQFIELARGGGGIEAIETLVAAQHSRHLILLRGVLQVACSGGRPEDQLAVAGYHLLAKVQERDPGAAATVIRYPSVGAWALHTLRGTGTIPGTGPGGLAAVAAAAAIRAKIPAEIEVPVTNGKVFLPSLGAADADGSSIALVRTNPAEIRSAHARVAMASDSPRWHEQRSIRAGSLSVLVDDLDPFRMPADDGEPTGRLTQPEVTELADMLQDAWEVLDPASAADIAALVTVIVPYQAPDSGYVSTSSPESFGAIAMSRQFDRYMCAETLIHEAQHLKLCAVLDLVRLTLPDDGQRYYAPWRDDPRPASALLQGAYAFLGVSGFWRRQRHAVADPVIRARAEAEFARWRHGSAMAVRTLLDSGQLTPAGHDFVREMERVLQGWLDEPVSTEALAAAEHKAGLHRERWRTANQGGTDRDDGAAPIATTGVA
jgi:HEXXH motif-containing protein